MGGIFVGGIFGTREFQRRQSELHCYIVINYQFTLIVFTQVNSRPTMLFYSLVFLLFIGSEPMVILQPSILIPFSDD